MFRRGDGGWTPEVWTTGLWDEVGGKRKEGRHSHSFSPWSPRFPSTLRREPCQVPVR